MSPILPIGSHGPFDAKATVFAKKQGHGQALSDDPLSHPLVVSGVVDHHWRHHLLDESLNSRNSASASAYSDCSRNTNNWLFHQSQVSI